MYCLTFPYQVKQWKLKAINPSKLNYEWTYPLLINILIGISPTNHQYFPFTERQWTTVGMQRKLSEKSSEEPPFMPQGGILSHKSQLHTDPARMP